MNKNSDVRLAGTPAIGLDNEQIYSRIFEAIVDHKLAPGTHLKEDELCDIFEIGRTRMRAVLSRLAADHVVDLVTNRGAFVARPSVEEAREVFRARRVVEGHLIRRAAELKSPAMKQALTKHLCHEDAARRTGDAGAVIKRCGKYHQVLAEQADSPIMAHFVRELIARSSLIVAIYESAPPDECELDEHHQLSELILAGEADRAGELMETHLLGIEARLDLSSKPQSTRALRDSLV